MMVAVVNPIALARHADVAHALTSARAGVRLLASDTPTAVDALFDDDLGAIELLIVVGGDGTASNLLTRAALHGRLGALPPLLLLPLGELGTAARVLVGDGAPAELAERVLVAWGRGVRRVERLPVARVRTGDSAAVGFTATLGAVARAHRDYQRAAFAGAPGLAEVLARLAVQRLPAERFRPLPGGRASDASGATLRLPDALTAVVVSALPSFFGVVRPFRGCDALAADGLHAVLSALGPFATRLSLPQLLIGARPPGSKLAFASLRSLELGPFADSDVATVDGDLLPIDAGAAVTIDVADRVRVVAWRTLPIASPAGAGS